MEEKKHQNLNNMYRVEEQHQNFNSMYKNKPKLTYKDEEGNILKGFSQIDLDKLNQKLKVLIIVFCIGLLFFMSVIIWILWQIKHYKIITHLIQAL